MAAVLILSAGRRVALVRLFAEAAHRRGLRVIAADMRPDLSAACHVADAAFALPHVADPGYPAALRALCEGEHIRLAVPTLDTELPVLSALRAAWAAAGTTLAVSDPELVAACADKRATAAHFAAFGLASPTIMDRSALSYPLLVKPYDGSLSKGLHVLASADQLSPALLDNPKNMFCEYLSPDQHDEFTCDAYYDDAGQLKCVVPRLRIEVRGGEIAKGRTVRNAIVDLFADRLRHIPGARGCLTIQLMVNRSTGAIRLIEVNARFGGGYPLSAAAGAAYHEWLIAEHVDRQPVPPFDGWRDGLLMLRFDEAVYV